ncbi:DUF4192 domain-containing protein [Gordonia rhizosphera]|uniref:DUF4192 domain-containing protein n=1 Tax=Gordonia rhizosphera NBRC 16068 TaxID=1108045 RepID=K6W5U6_9ACTN|nr:DUF4192 domain-containing protein [Gordonia rhizosphera]GAB89076.1 hypothetical protein GORHZ_049_00090 [Gordonia rhizosphera NBRC 16068]
MSNIRITAAPAELIAALPALMGFIPTESVVVIGVRDGRVQVTMRHDADTIAHMADHMAAVAAHHHLPTALVIAVTAGDGRHPVQTMTDALTRRGIEVVRRLHTTRCDEPAPFTDYITGDTGTSSDYRTSTATAGRVFSGLTVAASRDDLSAEFDTTPAVDTSRYDPATIDPISVAAAVVAAMTTHTIDDTGDLAARVGAVVTRSLHLRDALLRVADYDPAAAAWVYTTLSRPLRGRRRAEVLIMAAFCHYAAGHGARAGIALDRATEETGTLPALGALLDRALRAGVPPTDLVAAGVIPTAALADDLIGGHFPRPDEV